MLSITPVRERISERFPVASFVVNVPADRYFEVACATDPRLFRGDHKHRRTAANFATSRLGGLLRAPAGQATYLIPPQTLKRFAGARRLYYALATFRGARNEDPILTLSAERLDRTPSIQIAPDFTGRSLDRGKLGAADARYGGTPGVLTWGGDELIGPPPAAPPAPGARIGNAAPASEPLAYDDGFDASLWSEDPEAGDSDEEGGEAYGRPRRGGEPSGYEDAAELLLCAVEPTGYEDASALPGDAAWSYGAGPAAAPPPPLPPRPAMPPPPPPPPLPAMPPPPVARYGGGAAAAPAHHHERYGSVARSAPVYGGGDPEGYEDVPDLVRNLGPHTRPFYGNGAAALPAPVSPPSEPAPSVRFPDYTDELGAAEALPELAAVPGPDDVFTPSDPRHRLRIIDRAALAESGSERYRKVSADASAGLLWGHCQFAQRFGALGHVLRVCHRRDRAAYVGAFGEHNAAPVADELALAALAPGNLLAVTNAARDDERMAAVMPPTGGAPAPLWQAPWLDVFRAAGDVQAFQEAQREVADRRFYLPYIDVLRWLGIESVRGHAMFVDRALAMGGGGAARWLARTVGPVRGQDDLRRALAHLGFADLRAFQAAPPDGVTIPAVDGVFGPLTHAALAAALRRRGDSPLPVRSEDDMLAALVGDAERQAAASPLWRTAASRLRALRDDPALVQLPAGTPRGEA